MIAKLLLISALFIGWLYILTQSGISRPLKITLYAILGAGAYFVLMPETATSIANLLGIGRGTDLIVYIWIIFTFGVLLNVHLKLRHQLNLVTQMARYIAIASAKIPDNDPDAPGNTVTDKNI